MSGREGFGVMRKFGTFVRLLGMLWFVGILIAFFIDMDDSGVLEGYVGAEEIVEIFAGLAAGVFPGILAWIAGGVIERRAARFETMGEAGEPAAASPAERPAGRSRGRSNPRFVEQILAHNLKEIARVMARGQAKTPAPPGETKPGAAEHPTTTAPKSAPAEPRPEPAPSSKSPPTVDRPVTRRKSIVER